MSAAAWVEGVAWVDRAAALAVTAGLFLVYPAAVAAPLALIGGGSLLFLASKLSRRKPEGFLLQLAAFLAITIPFARDWAPFGYLLPAFLAVTWTRGSMRREFGVGREDERPTPLPVVMAIFLALLELGYLATLQNWLLMGHKLGVFEVLVGPGARSALGAGVAGILFASFLRIPLAYALTPWVLAPVVLSLHPLGLILFPLGLSWLHPEVGRWYRLEDPGPLRKSLATLPMVLGLVFQLGWVPFGTCERHDRPLRAYPYRRSPIFADHLPEEIPKLDLRWDVMKVTCPMDELQVALREEQRACKIRRGTALPEDLAGWACPFDRGLRERFGFRDLPENRFEPSGASRGPTGCRTCATYGLKNP